MDKDYLTGIDLDGDGLPDAYGMDADGDGVFEAVFQDTYHDGNIDAMLQDTDHDGYVDTMLMDTDHNGVVDTRLLDLDHNGTFETMERDVDENGIFEQRFIDEDDNGQFETLLQDSDQDGLYESRFMDADQDGVFDIVAVDTDKNGCYDSVMNAEDVPILGIPAFRDYENFDPNAVDSAKVIGEPQRAMRYWHLQEKADTCAQVSQEMVLDFLTGIDHTEQEIAEHSRRMEWYGKEGQEGTRLHDIGNVLIDEGCRVSSGFGATLRDLETELAKGNGVIVGVESARIAFDERSMRFSPGMGADHAIQVIGIDYSQGEPRVIVNDPGIEDGCGAMIPLDTFQEAWNASNCFMVSAEMKGGYA